MPKNLNPITNRLTIGEASALLKDSIKTLRRWHNDGLIHAVRNKQNQRLFDIHELEAIKNGRLLSAPVQVNHYYSISAASQQLGISIKTLRRWEKAGRINSIRNSLNQRVFSPDELLRAKKQHTFEQINPLASSAYIHHPFRASIFKSFFYSTALLAVFTNAAMLAINPKMSATYIDGELTPLSTNQLKLATSYRHLPANNSLLQNTQNVPVDSPPTHSKSQSESITNKDKLNSNNDNIKQQNGTNVILSGYTQTIITTNFLTPASTIIVTFEKDYSPATRYWITKELTGFTVHLDQPAVSPIPFSYLVIY